MHNHVKYKTPIEKVIAHGRNREQPVAGRGRRSVPGRNPVGTFHGLGADRVGLVRRQFQFSPPRCFRSCCCCRTSAATTIRATPPFWSRRPTKRRRRSPRSSTRSISARSKTPRRRSWMSTPRWKSPPRRPRRRNITTTARSSSTRAAARRTASKDVVGGGGGAMAFGPGPKVTGAAGHRHGAGHGQGLRQRRLRQRLRRPRQRQPQGHVGHRRRHQAYRTGGDRRPGLAGQPPDSDGSWSLQDFQRSAARDKTCTGTGDVHGRCRRHGDGPAALPGRRANAQVQRPLSRNISSRASTGSSVISSPTATWPRARSR